MKKKKIYIDYRRYDEETAKKVCEYYKQYHDINTILKFIDGMDFNSALSILTDSNNIYDSLDLCQLYINDKKIILNSDPHYGSIYDNPKYPNNTFDYAKGEGINTILLAGDLIEGNVHPKNDIDIFTQAYYFLSMYPHDNSIVTHAIGGNHDHIAAKKEPKVIDILGSREDIDFMGFKKSYINWRGTIISLQHYIKKYYIKVPEDMRYIEEVCFRGHSHMFRLRGLEAGISNVYIPASCDDPVRSICSPLTEEEVLAAKPGFLEAEHFGDHIVVTNYTFEDNKINKGNEHILTLRK